MSADGALRAALEGVVADPAAVVEDLDLARFVDGAGEVDQAAVDALAERYKTMTGGRRPPGTRGAKGLAEARRRWPEKAPAGERPGQEPAGRGKPVAGTRGAAGLAEARRRFGPPPDAA